MLYFLGILWPLEAMPDALRYISYTLPQTCACEAMRAILLRGWGLDHPMVARYCMTMHRTTIIPCQLHCCQVSSGFPALHGGLGRKCLHFFKINFLKKLIFCQNFFGHLATVGCSRPSRIVFLCRAEKPILIIMGA